MKKKKQKEKKNTSIQNGCHQTAFPPSMPGVPPPNDSQRFTTEKKNTKEKGKLRSQLGGLTARDDQITTSNFVS